MKKGHIAGFGTPALALAALLSIAPIGGHPGAGIAKAEGRITVEAGFEIADGRRHSREYRDTRPGHAKGLRAEIRRQRIRIDQLYAEAAKAERRARRAGKRARRAIDPYASRKFRKAKRQALRDRDRAELAAIRSERRLSRLVRQSQQISNRQRRVDRLAPRPKLAPKILRKIERYAAYRRRGENTPAFVVRIAEAEKLSARRGQSVAFWLNDENHRPRGRIER
ncbi:MAG: hypothetical protein AAF479_02210 [Pseudomonadota bacterium]